MGNPPLKGKGIGISFLMANVAYSSDECLIWPFSLDTRGYGHFGFNNKMLIASRHMCVLTHGPSPSSKHQAAHSCHNPACVNPNHLSWKTASGNQLDRTANGTRKTNKTGSRTPLGAEKISQIKSWLGTMTVTAIARNFGVSRRTVERIRAGRQYKPPGQSVAAKYRRARKSSPHTAA